MLLHFFVPLSVRNQGMRVVLGAHDITKKEKSQQWLKVEKFFPHPEYSGKYVNDIMLIKVNPNIYSDNVLVGFIFTSVVL